ncbi:MAG: MerR family transcriptional regulator [Lachnospiraceae bacterium]|nr:MerR family transcriptional regulator [Lachnospiraceae bacterium]
MSQYMSIGKISKLKNVSIKSLRYYDQIGILKPAFVNTETNYRYYTEDQLYLLDAITVCIKLGIPLKDLNNYVENDSINLQKLLYDGKILAEQKILEIHNCLGTLQETLQNMSGSVTGMAKIPKSKSGILLPDGFYHNTIAERRLLIVPLDEMDTPKYYGQHILKLFVTAQQRGITASYPSGVLHEYKNGNYTRYMFLTLNQAQNTDNMPDSGASFSEGSFYTLPKGDYACRRISTHMGDFSSIKEEMKEVIKADSFCIIETDTLSEQNKKDGYPFELEYCLSH